MRVTVQEVKPMYFAGVLGTGHSPKHVHRSDRTMSHTVPRAIPYQEPYTVQRAIPYKEPYRTYISVVRKLDIWHTVYN